LSPNLQKEKEESTNHDALITSLKMEIDSYQRENKHLREEISRYKQNIQLLQQQQLLQQSASKSKNYGNVNNYTNTNTMSLTATSPLSSNNTNSNIATKKLS